MWKNNMDILNKIEDLLDENELANVSKQLMGLSQELRNERPFPSANVAKGTWGVIVKRMFQDLEKSDYKDHLFYIAGNDDKSDTVYVRLPSKKVKKIFTFKQGNISADKVEKEIRKKLKGK